jgi:predicted esterase
MHAMLRWSKKLLPLLILVSLAAGQDTTDEYVETFRHGIKALRARGFDNAITDFRRCLELRPNEATCAYNLACAYSLKGESEPALAWLERAVDWGYGYLEGRVERVAADADLDSVRADPRYAAAIERMRAMRDRARAYAAKPAVYVPEALADEEKLGVLLVLHPLGGTKDKAVAGRWRKIADSLGLALVAPSGRFPTGTDPEKGMGWYDSLIAYIASPATYEAGVLEALDAFVKEHELDPAKVLLAGEGQGGALGLDVALDSPGRFAGVLVVNAAPFEQLLAPRAAQAGKAAPKVRFLLERDSIFGLLPTEDPDAWSARLRKDFERWQLPATIEFAEKGEPTLDTSIEQALRTML